MLLEVQVVGSAEWFEEALPAFKEFGFRQRKDLGWADPETDGELMGFYYDIGEDSVPFRHMADFIKEIEKIIQDGEAPYIKFNMVPDRKKSQ